jgi:DNA-binding transcriptional regulator YbjK
VTSERANTLLDAAISVVGSDGLRELTHRAVDRRADLPAGSTSYYFRTRSALLQGVLTRLLELDTQDYERFATGGTDRRSLTTSLVRLYRHWLDSARDRQCARYAIYLDAGADTELRALLDAANQRLATGMERMLRSAGCTHPRRDARLLIALLDGLLYDRIARPHPTIGTAELRRRIDLVLGTVLP